MKNRKKYPRYLYRYRPLGISKERDEQEFASLRECYLWFTRFQYLNDPAELANAVVDDIPESVYKVLESTSPSLSEIAKVSRRRAQHDTEYLLPKDSSSVCCFSEIHNHQAMWAYYANGFSGMCVKYDLEKLISLLGFVGETKSFR